jgi:hypothetical protein
MDQVPYPGVGTLFKIRFIALFSVLSLTDVIMLATAAESIMVHGVGAVVLFGNEVTFVTNLFATLKLTNFNSTQSCSPTPSIVLQSI